MPRPKKKETDNRKLEKLERINSYKNMIIILLIVIIILLLLNSCDSIKKGLKNLNNYDIYELDCECDKTIDDNPKKDIDDQDNKNHDNNKGNKDNKDNKDKNKNNGNNNDSNNNNNSNNDADNQSNENKNDNKEQNDNDKSTTDEQEDLIIYDKDQIWHATSQLHVFRNPVFEMEEKIAPGSSNSYKFYIRNNKECNISYKIEFTEENPYSVNMKYKLKHENEYLTDHWVSYDELSTDFRKLKNDDIDEYTLEWHWEHDDANDTMAGKSLDAYYKLNITLYGEQVE